MVSNLNKVFAAALMCGAVGLAGSVYAATSTAPTGKSGPSTAAPATTTNTPAKAKPAPKTPITKEANAASVTKDRAGTKKEQQANAGADEAQKKAAAKTASAARMRARLNAHEAQTTKQLNEQSVQRAGQAASTATARPPNQTALNSQPQQTP